MHKKDTSSRYALPAWAGVFLVIGVVGLGWANLMAIPLFEKQPAPRPATAATIPRPKGLDPAQPIRKPEPAARQAGPARAPQADPHPADMFATIPFPSGSFALDEAVTPRILLLAEHLKASPDERVSVTGCAGKGRNLKKSLFLARQRARAIRDKLVDLDVSRQRITIDTRLVARSETGNDASANQAEIALAAATGGR